MWRFPLRGFDESDVSGEYTYFVGEKVSALDNIPEGFCTLKIPAQTYAKFTNTPGPMPQVCIDMWQRIWQMTPQEFGGDRTFLADFEVYDERACNPLHTQLDIFIGVK
jgi:predicted transcriptional regulator YdeE